MNDASIKIKQRKVSFVFEAYGGNKVTKYYDFTEGTPIGFTYLDNSYLYTIEKENSFVYIHCKLYNWIIQCYTKVQYGTNTTIEVIVFYI